MVLAKGLIDIMTINQRTARTVFLLGFLTLTACGPSETPRPPAAPPAVTVAAVSEREVNAVHEQIGRTEAVASVDLQARVQGILQAQHFTDGAEVEEGTVLFEIEPDQYQASVAVAEAAVASAEATHQRAAQYLKRLQGMKRGEVSDSDRDVAAADEQRTKAQVEQAKAQLQLAQLDLDYSQITAPMSGRMGKAEFSVGNLVGPDSGVLVTLVQLDPIYVSWTVSERLITAFIKKRHEAGEAVGENRYFVPTIRLSDGDIYPHQGEITFIDNKVDDRTGTVALRATFPNPDKLLLPGQFVTVLLQSQASERKRVVPQAAIQQDQAGYFVLLVNAQNQVEQRRITVGERDGLDWIVEDGLQVGELVIYQGVEKVRAGGTVNPTVTEPADPAGQD